MSLFCKIANLKCSCCFCENTFQQHFSEWAPVPLGVPRCENTLLLLWWVVWQGPTYTFWRKTLVCKKTIQGSNIVEFSITWQLGAANRPLILRKHREGHALVCWFGTRFPALCIIPASGASLSTLLPNRVPHQTKQNSNLRFCRKVTFKDPIFRFAFVFSNHLRCMDS